jgi:hypothetical protein
MIFVFRVLDKLLEFVINVNGSVAAMRHGTSCQVSGTSVTVSDRLLR